jgi:carbonic anhydrase
MVATHSGGSGFVTLPGTERPDPREVLALLMEGNQHWVDGDLRHPHQSAARRREVAAHQDPMALVFSCIDSRVPPEIIFDRGVGDLFVFRAGAEAMDNQVVLGSVEFGPNGYASSRLIIVLGHEQCGAVTAAIAAIQSGTPAPGHIQAVVDALRPAYEVAVSEQGDLVDNMVRAQVRLDVAELKADPLLAALIADQGLLIVGGRYDLTSGAVEIIA